MRGLVLAGSGLTVLLVAFSEATPPPWQSLPIAVLAVASIAMLGWFISANTQNLQSAD